MSSLAIGLDIGGGHITAALVRLGRSSVPDLSIERDVLYTRSYKFDQETDPRSVIAIWLQCIDDILRDFVNHFRDDDIIVGIGIGLPGPMDYERGISHIQSSCLDKFNKFFGLNLRLSLECGLKTVVARWKRNRPVQSRPHLLLSQSSLLSPLSPTNFQPRSDSLRPPPPTSPISKLFVVFVPAIEYEHQQTQLSKKKTTDFCGDTTFGDVLSENEEHGSPISRSRRHTYFHDIEPDRPAAEIDRLSPQIWSAIEEFANVPITFYNDASCFALGEAHSSHGEGFERILALTLGTGFGSTFIDRGEVISDRYDVPRDGMLWHCPYDEDTIADDRFSVRGLIKFYKEICEQRNGNKQTRSVDDLPETNSNDDPEFELNSSSLDGYTLHQRALNGEPESIAAFRLFAQRLGEFLLRHIQAFGVQLIIIGGGLAHAYHFLEETLNDVLQKSSNVKTYFSLSGEKSICLGAVVYHHRFRQTAKQRQTNGNPRKTLQHLLPIVKTIDTSQYDLYPSHQIPSGEIGIGHIGLTTKIFELLDQNQLVLIDGFVGTHFDEFARAINNHRRPQQTNDDGDDLLQFPLIYETPTFLETNSNRLRDEYLGNPKSIFGKVASTLDFQKDFLDSNKFDYFRNNLARPCVVIGPGAALIDKNSPLIYIDLTKNELYYRIAAQTSSSYLKPTRSYECHPRTKSKLNDDNDDYDLTLAMYEQKCLYFLDYPVFNKLKSEILPRITFFVDGQRPHCPTWLDGDAFRQALSHLAQIPTRVRPWFEPGPWGGQWLKSVCKYLSKHPKNYAWSFEMITPENGLILSDVNHRLLEFSWDLFYGAQAKQILGNEMHCRLFSGANDFPIRFDFLDTIDGGNLSLQCHPNLAYIRRNFGEKITQDETYYILETKQHWTGDETEQSCVYLGFQDNVDPNEFHEALLASRNQKQELNVEQFVQVLPSKIHDFFLIPNETIHASGRHQVVLEISATPYIYTFKLYDWMRLGLDGNLRPLNIEHGMKNLQFDRRGENLRCQPVIIKCEQNKYEEQHLPTHKLQFFDVERILIEPNDEIFVTRYTNNRFHLCMLVEGDAIEIQFSSDNTIFQRYNYAETFLIPASIEQYRFRPIFHDNSKKNMRKFIILVAFLKSDCAKLLE